MGSLQGVVPLPQGPRLGRGRLLLLVGAPTWLDQSIDRPIDRLTWSGSTLSSQPPPTPFLLFFFWSRYSYTGLVSSAKHKTSTSTYVDLLGLTMITQLASVFFDAAWLLLLLVRRAAAVDPSFCMSLSFPFVHYC